MFKKLLMSGLLLLGFSGMQAQNTETSKAIVQQEIMFPFQPEHTHGSSIVQLPNGDLLSCWFQGNGERNADDVRVMGSWQKKGTTTWATPFLMADTKGIPDCNPVLYITREGKLFLFWVAVQANQWQYSVLRFRTSTKFMNEGAPIWDWQDDILLKPDDNFTAEVAKKFKDLEEPDRGWAAYAPKYDDMIIEASKDKMKRSFGWMTRIQPVTLASGRILLPLYSDGLNMSMVAISDDNGATWRPSLPIVGRGPIQPALAIRKSGEIVAYMRDSGDAPARVQVSTSNDQGESWTAAKKTDIPNEASVEIYAMKNGKWLYFGNDINDGRYKLSLYLSDDEGNTWYKKEVIEYSPDRKASFSYPCLIQTSDGLIHISYSYSVGSRNESIKHIVIDPKKITD
ncbi:MAG: glycoside hydrolase [Prolixibacteraceae bacterium]|nr:glycoside hydrolase [Prolixibacteraceae bacterium]